MLADRGGADSMLGAGAAPVRVPTFIDDVICAMRQMGASHLTGKRLYADKSTDMSIEGVFSHSLVPAAA